MPDVDPIIQALMGVRQYPTDDPIAGIQPPLQTPKPGMVPPPVNAAPNPNQVMSGVGDITGVNDAIKALRGQMTPEEQQGFAATAALGLLPGAGEMRPVAKAAEELAPPLYSAAAKAIQDARLTKASPEQWLGYLRNQPGVKQEELGYMGALPSGQSLTKDEMQQWANANQVQLKEVNKSNDKLYSNFNDAYAASPKFGNDPRLQLPGGQNYREVLMTMPSEQPKNALAEAQRIAKENGDDWFSLSPQGQASYIKNAEAQQPPKPFTSSHWNEPNVIAHARMNDRYVDNPANMSNEHPGQDKMLFLEELQSDLHQQGRKQGYANELPPGYTIDDVKDGPTRFGENDYLRLNTPAGTEASIGFDRDDLIANANAREGRRTVPDMPFKSTWPDLMLKRMVRHAAENGYDQLAWTPGDVQADRYDLSKQVNNLRAAKTNSGDYIVSGTRADSNAPFSLNNGQPIPGDKLPDHVGKDLADKIAAQDPGNYKDYSGLDLKVGSEGMRAFYDKMLVDKANAIGKKYGARVQHSSIDTGDYKVMQDSYSPPFRLESRNSPDIISRHNTADDAWAEAKRLGQQKVRVLPITPELKRAALTKGFPMFAVGGLAAGSLAGGQPATVPQDPNAQMLNALRGQVSQPTQPQ